MLALRDPAPREGQVKDLGWVSKRKGWGKRENMKVGALFVCYQLMKRICPNDI